MASKRKTGRPSKYTKELAADLCVLLAEGDSVEEAAIKVGVTYRSVFRWLLDHEEFRQAYARAKEITVEKMVEDMLQIASTPEPGETVTVDKDGKKVVTQDMLGHRKLQVDAIKWAACKLAPKKYGDRTKLEHEGTLTLAQLVEQSYEDKG